MLEKSAERAQQPLAVLTGVGGGLAPAVAQAFASAGYRLALVTRPGRESGAAGLMDALAAPPEADKHKTDDQGTYRVFGIDLATPAECSEGFGRLEAAMGRPSALLNLAGGYARGRAGSEGPQQLSDMLSLNLHTAVNATSAVLPGMLAQGSGFVAAVGAGAAFTPAPGAAAYAAAKGGLAAYFRSLAAEVGSKGINVALLVPVGAIDTPANRRDMPGSDPGGWLDPVALAQGLLYLSNTKARGRVNELVMTTS